MVKCGSEPKMCPARNVPSLWFANMHCQQSQAGWRYVAGVVMLSSLLLYLVSSGISRGCINNPWAVVADCTFYYLRLGAESFRASPVDMVCFHALVATLDFLAHLGLVTFLLVVLVNDYAALAPNMSGFVAYISHPRLSCMHYVPSIPSNSKHQRGG